MCITHLVYIHPALSHGHSLADQSPRVRLFSSILGNIGLEVGLLLKFLLSWSGQKMWQLAALQPIELQRKILLYCNTTCSRHVRVWSQTLKHTFGTNWCLKLRTGPQLLRLNALVAPVIPT